MAYCVSWKFLSFFTLFLFTYVLNHGHAKANNARMTATLTTSSLTYISKVDSNKKSKTKKAQTLRFAGDQESEASISISYIDNNGWDKFVYLDNVPYSYDENGAFEYTFDPESNGGKNSQSPEKEIQYYITIENY